MVGVVLSILIDVSTTETLPFGRLREIEASSPSVVVAMTLEAGNITAAELLRSAEAVAEQLPQPGHRVLLRTPNAIETLAALHGIWLAGCSAVLASPMTPEAEVERRIAATGAAAVLIPDAKSGNEVRFTRFDETQSGEAAVIFTSGTTGSPKAASIAKTSLWASTQAVMKGLGLPETGRPLAVPARSPQVVFVSLAHMGGLLATQTSWGVGKPILLVPKFSVEVAFEVIERCRLSTLSLTPAMVYDLAYAEGQRTLGTVASVSVGTAPLPENTRLDFENRYGVPVLRNYGQTEFAGAIAFERLDDIEAGRRPPHSVGRLAPGVQVRIVDRQGGDLPYGEVGEIWALGKSAMTGYLGESRTSARRAGWIATGDLGTVDADGFVTVVGRLRDMLICGGFNVYPAIIEAAVNDLPDVVDSVAAGLPDERLGEIPVVAVVLEPGAALELDPMRDALRSKLAAYELPCRLLCVDKIPRTPNGKLDRRAIATLFTS